MDCAASEGEKEGGRRRKEDEMERKEERGRSKGEEGGGRGRGRKREKEGEGEEEGRRKREVKERKNGRRYREERRERNGVRERNEKKLFRKKEIYELYKKKTEIEPSISRNRAIFHCAILDIEATFPMHLGANNRVFCVSLTSHKPQLTHSMTEVSSLRLLKVSVRLPPFFSVV